MEIHGYSWTHCNNNTNGITIGDMVVAILVVTSIITIGDMVVAILVVTSGIIIETWWWQF